MSPEPTEAPCHTAKLKIGTFLRFKFVSSCLTVVFRIIRAFMNGEIKIVKEATEKKAAEANRNKNK